MEYLQQQSVAEQEKKFLAVPGGVWKGKVSKKGKHQEGRQVFHLVTEITWYDTVIEWSGGEKGDCQEGEGEGDAKRAGQLEIRLPEYL